MANSKHVRNVGDPARAAAARARREAEARERAAAEAAYWDVPADARPADLAPDEDIHARHHAAKAALEAAQQELVLARDLADTAHAYAMEGKELAELALRGNRPALDRLHTQVCGVHPAIIGFVPAPDPDETHFHADMKDLGLVVDIPTTPATPDDTYVADLAEAMRSFVRRFEPKTNTPNRRIGAQGYAFAETRAGRLLYHRHPKRPAFLKHADDRLTQSTQSTQSTIIPPDTDFATLEEALAALPGWLTLTALSDRRNLGFPRPPAH